MWRALHAQIDPPPHVLEDPIGLRLIAPHASWRDRPDMDPVRTRRWRATMVARTRFIEDRVAAERAPYVLLGAGLDTFAQRRPELASQLGVFELEQPATQAWKRARLVKLGFGVPPWLRLVPVDFESGESWLEHLVAAGFDRSRPAVVASTGVVTYLSRDAVRAMLEQVAALAPGSTLALSFMVRVDLVEPEERQNAQAAARDVGRGGAPSVSLFSPDEMIALAREIGLIDVQHVSAADLAARYFGGRTDGLKPSSTEALLVATTR